MNKNLAITLTLTSLAVIAAVVFYFADSPQTKQSQSAETPTITQEPEHVMMQPTEDPNWGFNTGLKEFSTNVTWLTYQNADTGISFEYPQPWELTVVPSNSYGDSGLSLKYPNQERPFYQTIELTRWSNITDYFNDSDSNLYPGETFPNLQSYAASRNMPTIPELSIGGEATYFRLGPANGALSVLVAEHNGEIYELLFVEKDPIEFTVEDQRFVSSIQFID